MWRGDKMKFMDLRCKCGAAARFLATNRKTSAVSQISKQIEDAGWTLADDVPAEHDLCPHCTMHFMLADCEGGASE
jgi:hypothetical protein